MDAIRCRGYPCHAKRKKLVVIARCYASRLASYWILHGVSILVNVNIHPA